MTNYRAELTGVFGDPVDDNPTGAMMEAAFAALGLNFRYITMRVAKDDLAGAMAGMRAVGMKGVNMTMPHKVAVLPFLDELSKAAGIIGAVNTVVRRDGRLFGDNTDGKGFLRAIVESGFEPMGKNVCVFGAGGASRAICAELALAGAARITVINRNEDRGKSVAEMLRNNTEAKADFVRWEGTATVPCGTDLVINATPVGMMPDTAAVPDIDFSTIKNGMTAADVVFLPSTPFLDRAAESGAKTVDGLGMLVWQGAIAFELWTGKKAPSDVMRAALIEAFGL